MDSKPFFFWKQKASAVGKAKAWHVFDQLLLLRPATWISETKFSDKIELNPWKEND